MKKIFSLVIALAAVIAANATDYYFAGAANSWSNNNSSYKFIETATAGTYELTIDDLYGDFKITEDGNWHPQWGASADTDSLRFNTAFNMVKCDDSQGEADAPANVHIALAENYRYQNAKLQMVISGTTMTVTLVSGTLYDHSAAPTSYYLVGGCTDNWSTSAAIEFVDVNGVLTANIPDLNGTFKIIKNREWGWEAAAPSGTKIDGNNPFTLSIGGDNISFKNPFAGYKNAVMTLDMSNAEAPVITLVSGDFYVFEANWYVPGTKLGWNIDETTQMTAVTGAKNTYEYLAAEFSSDFKVVYGNWAVEYGVAKEDTISKWAINTPMDLATPCNNIYAATEDTYTDVTITIVVDYEAATVKLTIASEVSAVENVAADGKAAKRIENGQLVIEKDGIKYNALGVQLQ